MQFPNLVVKYQAWKLCSSEKTLKITHSYSIACVLFAGSVMYWFFGQKDILPWAVQEIIVYGA